MVLRLTSYGYINGVNMSDGVCELDDEKEKKYMCVDWNGAETR